MLDANADADADVNADANAVADAGAGEYDECFMVLFLLCVVCLCVQNVA